MRELVEKRNEHSKTYLLDDGVTYRTEISSGPRHWNKNGQWVDFDRNWADSPGKKISGDFPYPIDFDLTTRTATIHFGAKTVTVTPTLGVRSPTVTTSGDTITLAGLWRGVNVKATITKTGLKFSYTKTSTQTTTIAWQLGGDFAEFIGPVGYYDAAGGWVTVPSTLVGGLLTIDLSGVAVGQEIDPTFAIAAGGADGQILYGEVDTLFDSVRNATAGSSTNYTSTVMNSRSEQYYNPDDSTTSFTISRCFMSFDTSAIPSGDTVTSGSLALQVMAVLTGSNKQTHLVAGSQASTSSLVNDDYDNLGATSFGSVSPTSTGLTSITLNSDGLAAITKAGWTKLALRHYYDLVNATPPNGNHGTQWATYEHTTAQEPQLTVEHSSGGASTVPISLLYSRSNVAFR